MNEYIVNNIISLQPDNDSQREFTFKQELKQFKYIRLNTVNTFNKDNTKYDYRNRHPLGYNSSHNNSVNMKSCNNQLYIPSNISINNRKCNCTGNVTKYQNIKTRDMDLKNNLQIKN